MSNLKKQIDTVRAISFLVGLNLLFIAFKIFAAIDDSSQSISHTLAIFIPIACLLLLGFMLFRRYMVQFSRCPFCYHFHKIGDPCPKKN